MKRIICLILALLMLTPTAFADTARMTYCVNGGEGKIGDVIKVVLSVEDAPACIAYETSLVYDPKVLQPTGDYQKMYLNGLLVVNTDAEIEGQKMIKIAAVAITGNLLEGTMDLLNVSFKIIGTPEDARGSLIEAKDFLFSNNDDNLSAVSSLIAVPARVKVLEGGASDTPDSAPETEEEPKEEQGGDWYFDDDQAIEYYPDNSKDSTQYDVEYEKDEEGKTTGVILYDKEDKAEAGRLEVEEDEYGNLIVTDQQMKDEGKDQGAGEGDGDGEDTPFSPWYLIPIGAAVLIAAGGVVLAIKMKKKK